MNQAGGLCPTCLVFYFAGVFVMGRAITATARTLPYSAAVPRRRTSIGGGLLFAVCLLRPQFARGGNYKGG